MNTLSPPQGLESRGEYSNSVKPSDETVNNSDSLQDDDDLQAPVQANTTYHFEVVIIHESSIVAGIKFGWAVPTGATMDWDTLGAVAPITLVNQAATKSVTTAGVGTVRAIKYAGRLIVGANAGNFILRFAQNVAEATNTKILKGSCLRLWKA